MLVVDDDELVLELAAEFLTRAGFEVERAQGGQEALERASEHRFDAVVLDAVMPDVQGEDVLRKLRDTQPELPVVLVTGFGDEATLRRFERLGVKALLRKPYESEALVERVALALSEPPEDSPASG